MPKFSNVGRVEVLGAEKGRMVEFVLEFGHLSMEGDVWEMGV